MNVNKRLCKECGGKCCKNFPGLCLPSDFGDSKETIIKNIAKALISRKYIIEKLLKDGEEGYVVRPKTIEETKINDWILPEDFYEIDIPFYMLWSNNSVIPFNKTCIFFNERYGCKLPYWARPTQCKMLKPGKEECILLPPYLDRNIILAWHEYITCIPEAIRMAINLKYRI